MFFWKDNWINFPFEDKKALKTAFISRIWADVVINGSLCILDFSLITIFGKKHVQLKSLYAMEPSTQSIISNFNIRGKSQCLETHRFWCRSLSLGTKSRLRASMVLYGKHIQLSFWRTQTLDWTTLSQIWPFAPYYGFSWQEFNEDTIWATRME